MDSARVDDTCGENKKAVSINKVDDLLLGNEPQLENQSINSSSSSSSLTSEDDDFFQLDLGKPINTGNAAQGGRTSPQPDLLLGTTQSPLVQTMSRNDVPDPNRIPSSVFARTKSTTPIEWSVASNESLFSIHLGNNSFSRDHVILLKSGDFTNFCGSNLDIGSFSAPTSPAPVSEGMEIRTAMQQQNSAEAVNAEAMKDVMRAAAVEKEAKGKPLGEGPASFSRNSDCSVQSFRSFAFPILTEEGRSGSVKELEPEQPNKQQPSAETPKAAQSETPDAAAGSKRFPCFSCSFCC